MVGHRDVLTREKRDRMEPRRFGVSARVVAWASVLFLLGAACAGAAWLLAPVLAGQQAVASGRLEDGLQRFAVADARLSWLPAGRRLLPALADLIVGEQLAAMYGLHQYDQVIDKAGVAASATAQFWAGCALFVKADVDVSDRNRLNWMTESQQAFRAAMEGDHADFDARFNYELVGRVIAGMKKDPTAERPRDLHLLIPSSAQAPKKVS